MNWYILTGEYPPAPGGVSDYTQQVAEGLDARGEKVWVFAPATWPTNAFDTDAKHGNVQVHRLLDGFSWRGLRLLVDGLNDTPAGGRLMVQYVPHAFGWKAMNIPLLLWLGWQRRHALWVMFHEVAFPVESGQPWRHALLARVNRWMARRLATRAERVLVSTTAWLPLLRLICGKNVPADEAAIPSNFETLEPGGAPPFFLPSPSNHNPIIGHFGTFAPWIVRYLEALVPAILKRCPMARFALVGRGSKEFVARLGKAYPALRSHLFASGEISGSEVTASLMRCDVLVQPYQDGINTRRTSAMCGLALGRPIVTHIGHNSEPIWRGSEGVCLVESENPEYWAVAVQKLLDSPSERHALGRRGASLYWTRFSLGKTLDLLLKHPVSVRK